MAYKIVAQKDDATMRSERESLLIAAAKARIWAEEGWEVSVTDSEGRRLDRVELDRLFAAGPSSSGIEISWLTSTRPLIYKKKSFPSFAASATHP